MEKRSKNAVTIILCLVLIVAVTMDNSRRKKEQQLLAGEPDMETSLNETVQLPDDDENGIFLGNIIDYAPDPDLHHDEPEKKYISISNKELLDGYEIDIGQLEKDIDEFIHKEFASEEIEKINSISIKENMIGSLSDELMLIFSLNENDFVVIVKVKSGNYEINKGIIK